MISDPKTQNRIVVATIIITLVSAFTLVSNAAYYGGSYAMVSTLDVRLNAVNLVDYDPANLSINPRLDFVFGFRVPLTLQGDANLMSLTAAVKLDGNSLSYTNFRLTIPADNRSLYPGYRANFTVSGRITDDLDKAALLNATNTDTWVFQVTLTIFYRVLDSPQSVRRVQFLYEGVRII